MAAHRRIDWERIEPGWRAGVKSVLQIAADYTESTGDKVSHTAINKHFRDLGVPRDLSAKIKARADLIVSASIVSGNVSTETTETTAKIINENAVEIAHVRLAHRKDIGRSRTLAMKLLEELEGQTHGIADFAALGELMRSPDERGQDKLNELYQKVISLPGRTKTMKDLGDTLKTLVGLERQAFSIDDGTLPDDIGSARQFTVTYRTSPHAAD